MNSAALDPSPPRLEAGDHLNQPRFHSLYKGMRASIKRELIGGVVYMPSPVADAHSSPHADFPFWLGYYRAFTPGVRTMDNGTTILANDSEPQPDAALRIESGGQTRVNDEGYVVGCPELVFEVANTSAAYDLHAKRVDTNGMGRRSTWRPSSKMAALSGLPMTGSASSKSHQTPTAFTGREPILACGSTRPPCSGATYNA